MLSEAEQHEIRAQLGAGAGRVGAADALLIVQRHRRWISDETLRDVAAELGLTPDELDALATFYDKIYRRPVGRHVINVCDSVSCHVMGYQTVLEHLRSRLGVELGGTTADGRFTLLPTACLGACDRAPAIMIDDDLHTNLDPRKIDEILARYT